VVSNKKKLTVMNPIRMKKRNPSSGQNGQLVHWWLLIHFARTAAALCIVAINVLAPRACNPESQYFEPLYNKIS